MKKIVIIIVLANLLAGCPDNIKKDAVTAPTASSSAAPNSGADSISAPATRAAPAAPAQTEAADQLNQQDSILANRSTYYPFDVSVVQEADIPLVQAHGKYLSEHPNRKVRLEGNCDERGSNEYNLGLGQRRADGVKDMLLTGGARENQLETFSYGEELPRVIGHNEAAWKQNRRTDLNYK